MASAIWLATSRRAVAPPRRAIPSLTARITSVRQACNWDGTDCFHGYGECYTKPDGSDYRGSVNVTEEGVPCMIWQEQYQYTSYNYPAAGLGGHNRCRNPDGDEGPSEERPRTERPWCFRQGQDGWGFCTVPPPQDSCRSKLPNRTVQAPSPASEDSDITDYYDAYNSYYDGFPWGDTWTRNASTIELNKFVSREMLGEHRYEYFDVAVPADIFQIKVVVVPLVGDPDLYLSFDNEFPTGGSHTFMSDRYGPEEFTIDRNNYLFCGSAGHEAACTLHISVLAFDEESSYSLIVYGVKDPTAPDAMSTLCAPGCDWLSVGDGVCNPQCNVEECFLDRGDCHCDGPDCTDGCPAECDPSWIGDRYCDEACFVAACQWDKHDCLKKGEKPCADHCLPTSINDGEARSGQRPAPCARCRLIHACPPRPSQCDAACNVESCGWDGSDCFYDHDECFEREDGADYRGKVATTESGMECQFWSEQSPQQHTRTHQHYPRSGVGGHNYCRNPDREVSLCEDVATLRALRPTVKWIHRRIRGATWPRRRRGYVGTTATLARRRRPHATRRRHHPQGRRCHTVHRHVQVRRHRRRHHHRLPHLRRPRLPRLHHRPPPHPRRLRRHHARASAASWRATASATTSATSQLAFGMLAFVCLCASLPLGPHEWDCVLAFRRLQRRGGQHLQDGRRVPAVDVGRSWRNLRPHTIMVGLEKGEFKIMGFNKTVVVASLAGGILLGPPPISRASVRGFVIDNPSSFVT